MDVRLLTSRALSDRYEERPFLRLLECYVMWAIGELPSEATELLDEMTPKLQATYQRSGTWPQIVEGEMEFSQEVSAELRSMWERNSTLAREAGLDLDPDSWARQVVDGNFV